MTAATPAKHGDISRAAQLLDAVGRHSDDHVAALHCLRAADALAQVGATTSRAGLLIRTGDTRIAIAEALRLLAGLPDDVFDNEHVTAATDAAQAAYQRAG